MAKKRPGPSKGYTPKQPGKPEPPPEGAGRKPRKFRLRDKDPKKADNLLIAKLKAVELALKKVYPPGVKTKRPQFFTNVFDAIKSDGSVTADLHITGINPRVSIDKILFALHEKLDNTSVNGAWLSIGFYNPPTAIPIEKRDDYKKTRGMLFYRTHSRRWTKALAATIVEQGRQSQANFKATHNQRPLTIVVRGWWNPDGRRPTYVTPAKRKKKPRKK